MNNTEISFTVWALYRQPGAKKNSEVHTTIDNFEGIEGAAELLKASLGPKDGTLVRFEVARVVTRKVFGSFATDTMRLRREEAALNAKLVG